MPGKKAHSLTDYKTKVIQIRLSVSDYQGLKEIAANKGLSVAELVRSLIPRPDLALAAAPVPDTQEITLPGYPGTFTVHNKRKGKK